jgi:predicted DNA-binding transcriptional regulator AlpA
MAITKVPKAALSAFNTALTAPPPAVAVTTQPIDLSGAARLRLRDVTALLNVSRTTLYEGMDDGRYPKPDGKDGQKLYWRAATIATHLAK